MAALGCSSSSPATFECYKVPKGPWRECSLKNTRCDEGGCFRRTEAYCFPYLIAAFLDEPERRLMVCTPTETECKEWNADRQHVVNRALGQCALARPDEYPRD